MLGNQKGAAKPRNRFSISAGKERATPIESHGPSNGRCVGCNTQLDQTQGEGCLPVCGGIVMAVVCPEGGGDGGDDCW